MARARAAPAPAWGAAAARAASACASPKARSGARLRRSGRGPTARCTRRWLDGPAPLQARAAPQRRASFRDRQHAGQETIVAVVAPAARTGQRQPVLPGRVEAEVEEERVSSGHEEDGVGDEVPRTPG